MKRGIRITLALLLVVSLLSLGMVGCTTDTTTTEPTTTEPTTTKPTTTEPTTTEPTTTEPTTTEPEYELVWSTPYFPFEIPAMAGDLFCTTVEEETGGRVKIERYYGEELGKAFEHLMLVQSGVADMGSFMTPYFPTELPMHNLLASTALYYDMSGIPGGTWEARVAGQANQHALMYDIPETKAMFEAEAQNVGVMFFEPLCVGPTGVVCTEEATSLADLVGLKIGSPIPSVAETWASLGLTPDDIQIMDAYESLSRGVIQCYAMVLSAIELLKWHEPCQSYIEMGEISWGVPMSINMDTWNSLPADIQAAFWKANEVYVEYALQAEYDQAVRSIQAFEDAGLTVVCFPAEDILAYQTAHREIADVKYSLGIMCPPENKVDAENLYYNYTLPMQEGTYWD